MDRPGFHEDLTLDELLPPAERAAALELCGRLLGCPLGLSREPPNGAAVAVVHDLEPVAWLAGAEPERLAPVAALLQLLCRNNARYHLAGRMHTEVVHQDYAELSRQHAELQASEARYKALSEQLEQRVQEQVGQIEAARCKLYASEKLASVGQLAAGVAHEINNPMGFIISNLKVAQEYLRDMVGLRELLKNNAEAMAHWQRLDLDQTLADFHALTLEALDGAQRVAFIVRDLKGFSHQDGAGQERAELNAIVRSTCNIAAHAIRERAELVLDLTEELPPVLCHPGQIGQALYNVVHNALLALESRGELRIATGRREAEVFIEVRDQGCGMDESVLAHAFEPFYTTRAVGDGMGLGLTVARDFVLANGGRIELDSAPGRGTRVRLSFPAAA